MLDAGLDAFARQPIALVSVLDITEAADVAKGVFYLHFASKDAFLIALWQDVQDAFLDAVQNAVAKVERGDDQRRSRLAAAIGEYARLAAEHPQRVCFLLRMSSFIGDELGTPGQLAERRKAYIEALARAVNAIGEKSRVTKTAAEAAKALDACCWGLVWQALQQGQTAPSAKELNRVVAPAMCGSAANGGDRIPSV